MAELMKFYTLHTCSLLDVRYTSIKLLRFLWFVIDVKSR